jgi:hypothetical protein
MKFFNIVVLCNLIISMSYAVDIVSPNFTEFICEALARHPQIYDFNESILTDASLEKRLEKLRKRKSKIIENELIEPLNERIKNLFDTHTVLNAGYRINRRTLSSTFRCVILPAVVFAIQWHYARGDARPIVKDMLQTQLLLLGTNIATNAFDTSLLPPDYEDQIQGLRVQQRNIRNALKKDPYQLIENEAVSALHRFPDMTRRRLGKLLLDLRKKTGGDASIIAEDIRCCLRLPTKFKRLFPDFAGSEEEYAKKRDVFLEQAFGAAPWCNYSDSTKQHLRSAMTEFCDEAEKSFHNSKTERMVWFFYGKPGTGKSSAAAQFAKLLGLPSVTITTSEDEEMNERKFTGNASFMEPTLGKLAETMTMVDSAGRSYKNAVLIIEDFSIDYPPTFLLKLFDSTVTSIKCDYFGKDYPLDISGLLIIITANTDLGKFEAPKSDNRESAEEDSDAQETSNSLDALQDRLTFIPFDRFNDNIKRTALSAYISENSLWKYSTHFNKGDEKDIEKEVIDFILKNFSNLSWRDQQRKTRWLFNTAKSDWGNFEQSIALSEL